LIRGRGVSAASFFSSAIGSKIRWRVPSAHAVFNVSRMRIARPILGGAERHAREIGAAE